MQQLLSLSTITRTVKPGVKGDRANGVAAVKPETQEIPKGVRFTPLRKAEYDELIKLGAARERMIEDEWDSYPLFKKDGEIDAGKSDEELAEEQRLLDEANQRRQDAAARVRAAAEAKKAAEDKAAEDARLKQEADDRAAADAETKRLKDEADARILAEQQQNNQNNNGGGTGEQAPATPKKQTAAEKKAAEKAAKEAADKAASGDDVV